MKQNPFTTTYSKLPEYTYIATAQTQEIIENFRFDRPTEAVYKITGIRGSGKTVIMSRVMEEMRASAEEDRWLIYSLNPSRDMLRQFAALLRDENIFAKKPASRSIGINASVFGTGAGIAYASTEDDKFFDYGAAIKKMLKELQKERYKVLLCVDEVSKTTEMVTFSLEFGEWLIEGYPVYLICTGLYENILELGNTKNLTFFRRGTSVRTNPLNSVRMTQMYKDKLSVDTSKAKKLAEITKGYAYAFQQLGVLVFRKPDEALDEIILELKTELYAYSYEKIWEELTDADKELVKLLTEKEEYSREDVRKTMGDKANNYSVYRDRLLKRGIISARQGYISLYPPFFGEYVREYYG